jgi:hypothetical protein
LCESDPGFGKKEKGRGEEKGKETDQDEFTG